MALQSNEWFGIVRDAYVLYCALYLADVLGLIRLPWSMSVACPADGDVFSSAVPVSALPPSAHQPLPLLLPHSPLLTISLIALSLVVSLTN